MFALADALGVRNFAVLGHDWGGILAWMVAAADAASGEGRVTRAVVANGPHPVLFQRLLHTDATQRAASQYIRQFRERATDVLIRRYGFAALLLPGDFGPRGEATSDEPRALLAGLGTPPERINAAALAEAEALLERWREQGAATAMLNWYRASPIDVPPPEAPLAAPDGWREQPFPRITSPTLVLWGEADKALPLANVDGLAEFVADLTVHRIAGCAHFSPWQAPEVVNAALDAFLPR